MLTIKPIIGNKLKHVQNTVVYTYTIVPNEYREPEVDRDTFRYANSQLEYLCNSCTYMEWF